MNREERIIFLSVRATKSGYVALSLKIPQWLLILPRIKSQVLAEADAAPSPPLQRHWLGLTTVLSTTHAHLSRGSS